MILEVAILDVRPGHAKRFEAAFEKAQKIIAAAGGYEGHELRKASERENRYLLLVWWDSLESHTVGFRGSPLYQEWKRLLHHFYDPFPQVEHYLPAPAAKRTQKLLIMVSGPYRTGSYFPDAWAANLKALNTAAMALFKKGHTPVIGVNMALPVIGQEGPEVYNAVMLPLSLGLAERCDAVLRIGGPSTGADEEVAVFKRKGLPIFQSLDEIPDASN
jgi:heme-degrading monooxygenase HmoA